MAARKEHPSRNLLEFGRIVRSARTESNLTQRGLADIVGVVQAAVSDWENGLAEPPPPTVFELEEVLHLTPGMLSRPLGYGPPIEPTGERAKSKQAKPRAVNLGEAILLDKKLSKSAKEAMLATYRALTAQSRCTAEPFIAA